MTGSSVQGRVIHASTGAPVADATIAVIAGPGAYPDIAVMTDDDGRFALGDMAAGNWRLGARSASGETGEASVAVGSSAVAHTVITVS
ncbi:carboxypeptidase regulatory-like domain-containing protein [Massilia sp. TWR1-2-2]|uniref:carboxypeptidase regulatory-like domain-containing protein n=1 Tax=Massilia sp. TWR1-2-2 TaxID=2804584 RepID=UPI003CE673DA